MKLIDALLDRIIDVLSEEGKTVIRIFSRTRPEFFTKLDKDLRIRCMDIKFWQEEAANIKSTALLKNNQKNLDNNPEFKNTIEFDMAEHSIKSDGNEEVKCACIKTNPHAVVDYVSDIPTNSNVTFSEYWRSQYPHCSESSCQD